MTGPLLTCIGLFLDIIGVCLLFRYGLPPNIAITKASYIVLGDPEEKTDKAKRYTRISYAALVLLVAGFALQGVAAWFFPTIM